MFTGRTTLAALRNALLTAALCIAACSGDVTTPAVPTPHEIRAQYQLVDLTPVVGSSASFTSLDQQGNVGGTANGEGFLWTPAGVKRLAGCVTLLSINTAGKAACYLNPGFGIWVDGTITPIPELGSTSASVHVSGAGTVTGSLMSSVCQPCLFSLADTRVERLDRPGFLDFIINGEGDSLFIGPHGEDYRSPYVLALANGSRYSFDTGLGSAYSMNDSGWVVGGNQPHVGQPSAFLLKHAATISLGEGAALSINNHGVIVGTFVGNPAVNYPATGSDPIGPFLWENGTASLLIHAAIDSSWLITAARRINDAGQILATADDSTAHLFNHTVLLTPQR